jgi:hypothetical protein
MTNKFFDYLQPTIVKTSDSEYLPENLRNRYFINFNIVGIKYFDQYYLLQENNNGIPYLIVKEDRFGIELEDSKDDYDKILDLPRIYINISENFINNPEAFREFFSTAVRSNPIYLSGVTGFRAGEDYWLNTTLFNYIVNMHQSVEANTAARMPNYLTETTNSDTVEISEYFVDLSNSPYKDYTNLEYYSQKNDMLDNQYTEDQLNDFYKNFCSIILEQTKIDDETKESGDNPIYNLVLNYYANYQSDAASNALNLVLNSLYSTTESTSSGCSCNSQLSSIYSSSTSSDTTTKACSTLYEEAMAEYLTTMLGDTQFYQDWFMIKLSEYEYVEDDVLCENLIEFVKEFLLMDFCLDFETLSVKAHNSQLCNHTTSSSYESTNQSTIENYLKVLNFVAENNITANTNRIKIWGEKFGKLLPNLQF